MKSSLLVFTTVLATKKSKLTQTSSNEDLEKPTKEFSIDDIPSLDDDFFKVMNDLPPADFSDQKDMAKQLLDEIELP
jgi:hypothetical protein